jgi:hypothetical protein
MLFINEMSHFETSHNDITHRIGNSWKFGRCENLNQKPSHDSITATSGVKYYYKYDIL